MTEKDFVGIFPNAASEEFCERCISRFNIINDGLPGHGGRVFSRQQFQRDVPRIEKDSDVYDLAQETNDSILVTKTDSLLQEFNRITWECYGEYAEKYGILSSLPIHRISPYIKIQRYRPSQGYHLWHDENSNPENSNRLLVIALYLNTVEEGGETEFLYQSMRVKPVQGTFLIHPAGFTHTHRGNPPLKGLKYFMNTWIISVDVE